MFRFEGRDLHAHIPELPDSQSFHFVMSTMQLNGEDPVGVYRSAAPAQRY